MRLRRFALLVKKEAHELLAARAYWLLLLMVGPLVGHAFITAVDFYAEASGIHGSAAALAQGLSPLDGIFVPTFGAYDLAVTLLFPFVAIRVISAEKESGGLKLMLQGPAGLGSVLFAKAFVLVMCWVVALIPGLLALLLWKSYGGTLYAPEVLNLLLGHVLRVVLSSGVALAAAALTRGTASAAIVTLGFTVGTWALEFIAAAQGGWVQRLAMYTPTSALRTFEQGELRLNTALVCALTGVAGFGLAAVWLPTGRTARTRAWMTLGWAGAVAAVMGLAALPRAAWDLSENRRNSFSPGAQTALRQIRGPLRVTVYLAAEDPRLLDLDRNILAKLNRVLPSMNVDYAAHTRTGLFEGSGDHYGEVWYAIGGRKAMSRSTTEPIVLETIYQLAGVPPPSGVETSEYPGHPLAVQPRGAAWLFYVLWPAGLALGWWTSLRNWI